MTNTRHSTLCVRPECRRPFSEHADGCPNGSGKQFRKHVRTKGASHSFLPDEVPVLHIALRNMSTDSELANNPALPRALRKVKTMMRRLEADQQEQRAG